MVQEMKSIGYLLIAACNFGMLIWDFSDHQTFWAIFQGVLGVIMFGLYVESVIDSKFTIPKPKRDERIYE